MPFFPVDDDFTFHRKAIAAGNAALGLWVRAGAFCMKQATDGILRRGELAPMGTTGQAKRLVEVELWHAHGHDCEACGQPPKGGWIFHDWTHLGTKKTSEAIKADRDAARDRMRRLRSGEQTGERSAGVRANRPRTFGGSSVTPGPVPDPSSGSSSSRLTVVSSSPLTDDDLDKIASQTGGGREHAAVVAAGVLDRAGSEVGKPLAYVLRAVGDDPARYRAQRRRTKDTCCPLPGHDSYPADNCGACRSEQLAGGA